MLPLCPVFSITRPSIDTYSCKLNPAALATEPDCSMPSEISLIPDAKSYAMFCDTISIVSAISIKSSCVISNWFMMDWSILAESSPVIPVTLETMIAGWLFSRMDCAVSFAFAYNFTALRTLPADVFKSFAI